MKIRIVIDSQGYQKGDLVDVSDVRGERWCNSGIAELATGETPEPAETEDEGDDAEEE